LGSFFFLFISLFSLLPILYPLSSFFLSSSPVFPPSSETPDSGSGTGGCPFPLQRFFLVRCFPLFLLAISFSDFFFVQGFSPLRGFHSSLFPNRLFMSFGVIGNGRFSKLFFPGGHCLFTLTVFPPPGANRQVVASSGRKEASCSFFFF